MASTVAHIVIHQRSFAFYLFFRFCQSESLGSFFISFRSMLRLVARMPKCFVLTQIKMWYYIWWCGPNEMNLLTLFICSSVLLLEHVYKMLHVILSHSHHMKSSETANDDHWKSILLFFDCRVYVCLSLSRSLWLCTRRSGDERVEIDKLFVLPHDKEITHSNQHKHSALRQHEHCFTCQLKLLFIIERKFYVLNFVQFYGTWTPDVCNN